MIDRLKELKTVKKRRGIMRERMREREREKREREMWMVVSSKIPFKSGIILDIML